MISRAPPPIDTLFASFLDGLPDGGVVMCHPGFVDAELQRLDHLTTMREQEYAFFAGERFPQLLARTRYTPWHESSGMNPRSSLVLMP